MFSKREAAQQEAIAAVDSERQRLAHLLQVQIVDPLRLLLSQINTYQQTLAPNPATNTAISVLEGLARQILQRVNDLEASLHSPILEKLGLEPALESLANQVTRAHGLRIAHNLERLAERPPPQVELAFYRLAQEALDRAVHHAHASQATLSLTLRAGQLTLRFTDNGITPAGTQALSAAGQWIEGLGGTAEITFHQDKLSLTASLGTGPPIQLTSREIEVIQLLAQGKSNKAIAGHLSLSPRTVSFHLSNIYSKLGVKSRTEAVILALQRGWVGPTAQPAGDQA